jgi:lysophospholipase L1-like esterase
MFMQSLPANIKSPAAPRRSPGKIIAFKLTLVLMPFILLLLLELFLRLFNYGYDPSLFVPYAENKQYLILNPEASRKFFNDKANAPIGNVEPFKKQKDAGTLRIFVLGESTTIGYPFFHNGSFHRWLQYRMMRSLPDQKTEIINLSLTAVNSYTVIDFAKQLLPYQPDAVLIYAGQNEYYGALGVGSTEQIASNRNLIRSILWLRRLRVIQLFTTGFGTTSKDSQAQKETRMQRMVSNQQISYASPVYQKGIDQFRRNMEETVQLLTTKGVPVFISNLVSNEKDLIPFSGEEARRNYLLARTAMQNGAYSTAKQYFAMAKELDQLRFRAPEKLNEIIEGLCGKYKNTYLVDTKGLFEAHSPNGIIGNELLMEHVHPNLYGYALMSDAFFIALANKNIIRPAKENVIPFDTLLADMPLTTVDSLAAAYRIARLKKAWPFAQALTASADTNTLTNVSKMDIELAIQLDEKKTGWLQVMEQLYNHDIRRQDYKAARRIAEGLLMEYPLEPGYFDKAAMISGELKDENRVLLYLKKSFDLLPSFEKARFIFVLYLQQNDPQRALPYLDYAIANNNSRFNLQPIRDSVDHLIKENNKKKIN